MFDSASVVKSHSFHTYSMRVTGITIMFLNVVCNLIINSHSFIGIKTIVSLPLAYIT